MNRHALRLRLVVALGALLAALLGSGTAGACYVAIHSGTYHVCL